MSDLKREALYVLKEEGVDETAASLANLADQERAAAAAAEILQRQQKLQDDSTTRLGSKIEQLTRKHDPLHKSTQELARFEGLVTVARKEGLPVSDAVVRSLDLAREKHRQLSAAMNDNAKSSGLARHELINLAQQGQDVVVSLAGGQNPFTVLLQQGSQIGTVLGAHQGGAGAAIKSLGGLIGGLLTPTVVATGAVAALGAATLAAASHAVAKLEEIDAGARKAGVSSDFFQVWTKQAKILKLEVDDLTAALAAARAASADTLEKGQVQIGSGGKLLAELQSAGKISRGDLASYLGADTQDARLNAVLRIMRELLAAGREVEALKLGEAFFGAPETVQKIADGLKAGKLDMEALTAEAKGAGAIFDAELVKRSEELNAELVVAYAHLSDSLKPVMQELGVLGLALRGAWVGIVENIAAAVQKAEALYARVRPVVEFIARAKRDGEAINQLTTPHAAGEPAAKVFDRMRGQSTQVYGPVYRPEATGASNADVQGAVDTNRSAAAAFLKGLEPDTKTSGAGRSRAPAAEKTDQVETYLAQLRKSVEVLQAEADAQGKSNAEKERAVDLARAEAAARERGTPLTEKEIADIERLAAARAGLRQRIEDTTRAEEAARQQMQYFGNIAADAFEKAIQGGASLDDTLQSVLKSLESAALKAALLGEGSLANLFGTQGAKGETGGLIGAIGSIASNLFSGKFAAGGTIPAGRWGVVGEHGPEPVYAGDMPLSVMPSAMARSAFGAARGGSGAAASPSEIHIHQSANTAVAVKESRTPQGGRRTDIQVVEAVTSALQSSAGRATLTQMGLRPKLPRW